MLNRSTANHSSGRLARVPSLLLGVAASSFLAVTTTAQGRATATPFGAPSECAPGGADVLSLSLTRVAGRPALRLDGGTVGAPALLLFSGEQRTTTLPGGGVMLVGPTVGSAAGFFDANGVFVQIVDEALLDSAERPLFAQGLQPMTPARGTQLSGGLQLTLAAERKTGGAPPESILVEEFAGLLRSGQLEAALDQALNSTDDALTLDLGGNLEVPVAPCVTVGGKAAFKASIKRGEDSVGAVVYDMSIGGDVAVSAGVGVALAGVGASGGVGMDVIWRFASTHEVARALRSMAILQAVGFRLEAACLALNGRFDYADRAVEAARSTADRGRAALRSRLPGQDNRYVKAAQRRQDELRAQRHETADRVRQNVQWLITWVAEARIFLITHQHGYELRQTRTVEGTLGGDLGDGATATAKATFEQQVSQRFEFVPESDALRLERKVATTKSFSLEGSVGVGLAFTAKRVLELTSRFQVGTDGVELAESGTTVKLTLDARLLAAMGVVATMQAGIGGDVSVALRLADLLNYSVDALDILMGDDDQKVVDLLLAFPIQFQARGRYEAGFALGVSLEVEGVIKFGLAGTAMMVDQAVGFEYAGSSTDSRGAASDRAADELRSRLLVCLRDGTLDRNDAGNRGKLDAVGREVARVMPR